MLKPRADSQTLPAGRLLPPGPHASAPAEPPASCTMPRSFLVKKIKGDGFQCSGVPAPTYHPLETAYVLPGARGPPGDNGEWDEGRGAPALPNLGHEEGRAQRGTPGGDFSGRARLPDFLRAGRAGLGLGRTKGKSQGRPIQQPRASRDFESCGPTTGLERAGDESRERGSP